MTNPTRTKLTALPLLASTPYSRVKMVAQSCRLRFNRFTSTAHLARTIISACLLLALALSMSILGGVNLWKENVRAGAGSSPSYQPPSNMDRHSGHHLGADSQSAACAKRPANLVCNIAKLNLKHSTGFTLSMQRLLDSKLRKTAATQNNTPAGAISLIDSTIENGQTVFDAPKQLTLTFNKDIQSFSAIDLSLISNESRQKLPATARIKGATITAKFNKPLPRNGSFELTVKGITALDGTRLAKPVTVAFQTSGGPKVKSTNIGRYSVSTTNKVILTFDTDISSSQRLDRFIKLEVNGTTAPAVLSRENDQIIIDPVADLPECARLHVRVLDGLENKYKVSGGSAWTYNARTACQSVFSIGNSDQGRAISAHRFGNGGDTILFVGTTHGDEQSSTRTLESLIRHLERNPGDIPDDRTVVVIPALNPDGLAANTRTNANNVDLNRNFPSNNWKQGVVMPDSSFNPNGGGNLPLHEPESKALADYILSVKPRLVLTYHSVAGVIIPNNAGDSDTLAKIYDQKSDLYYKPHELTDQIFDYDTTGSLEEWLHDKHSIPAILVELWTKSSDEFDQNQNAMRHMIRLP